MKKTMYEKILGSHLVVDEAGQAPLIYVDRHLMHEVTSPQAFEGLRLSGRKVRNPIVANMLCGLRTFRPDSLRPSKACGLVTSCIRWRST